MANRNREKWSTLLIIREIQIKTTVRYYLTSVRMVSSKRTQITNIGEYMEKREPSNTLSGDVNFYNHCEKRYGVFSKN